MEGSPDLSPEAIIQSLANGIDPLTGEVLPNTSPYNQPAVIRALFTLLANQKKIKSGKFPVNHGKPWTQQQNEHLTAFFKQAMPINEIAKNMGRGSGGIVSQLMKLGLVPDSQTHGQNRITE
jgi:hypothetical protein